MAIAFRAVGATTKVDTSATGTSPTVALPAGHVSNDLLFLPVFTDNNLAPDTPAGWTRLFYLSAGASTSVPYAGFSKCTLFYRIDNGSLGSSVTLTVSSLGWPTGKPYVLAWVAAYSGCDTANPIGEWGTSTDTTNAAALAHPSITTALANCWLLTLRGIGADAQKTFTDSVGTDAERVDDWAGFPASPSGAMYDSNAALTAGAQTVRTTTASGAAQYGSTLASVAIRPAAVAGTVVALAGTSGISFSAKSVTASVTTGPWDLCGGSGVPVYSFAVDWAGDGSFVDVGDDATGDVISEVSIAYGRDQNRQLNPAAVGGAAFSLINVDRKYSPEWASSVFFGNLEPARAMRGQVTWAGTTFPLFLGRIDDFNVKADMTDRSVDLTFLDALNDLSRINLSTEVLQTLRTGEIIDAILDEVGWTAGRQVDLGATIVKYWWADGTDALSAINDLVKSEGAPAIAYVAADGTFVFHDRHHRIQTQRSTTVQATYAQPALFDCTAVPLPGLDYTAPFAYAHGWRDIINSVSFEVQERNTDPEITVLWTNEGIIEIASGESLTVNLTSTDPFLGAIVPVSGTDYNAFGAGTLTVGLSRDSGASTEITLMATGGSVSVHDLQLRGQLIPVSRTVKVNRRDQGSISVHGERTYPDAAPWANANDANAIAGAILLRYAERRPTVDMRVVTKDPTHFLEIMSRAIGDRIHITNGEMGLDDDFFLERVTHRIQRFNQAGHAPVHSVVFGCEKATIQSPNPFRFDVRGAGFDQGVFDPINADSPFTVFVFDQGIFDTHVYGT